MSTMNIPGYTAEASLCPSRISYTAALAAAGGETSDVHPSTWGRQIYLAPRDGDGTGPRPICFGLCMLICLAFGRPVESCVRDCFYECRPEPILT